MFVLGTLLSPLVQLLKTDMIYILLYALALFVFRSTLKYIVSSLCISRIQNESEDSTLLWIGLTGQGILASGAAFECAFYVHLSPFIFLLFVTVLFLNQLIGSVGLKKSN